VCNIFLSFEFKARTPAFPFPPSYTMEEDRAAIACVEAPAPPRSHRTRRDRKRRADRDPGLVRRALDRERAVLMQKRRIWKRLVGEPHAIDAPPERDEGRDAHERGGEAPPDDWVVVVPRADARPLRRFLEEARAWLRRALGGAARRGGGARGGGPVPNDGGESL